MGLIRRRCFSSDLQRGRRTPLMQQQPVRRPQFHTRRTRTPGRVPQRPNTERAPGLWKSARLYGVGRDVQGEAVAVWRCARVLRRHGMAQADFGYLD